MFFSRTQARGSRLSVRGDHSYKGEASAGSERMLITPTYGHTSRDARTRLQLRLGPGKRQLQRSVSLPPALLVMVRSGGGRQAEPARIRWGQAGRTRELHQGRRRSGHRRSGRCAVGRRGPCGRWHSARACRCRRRRSSPSCRLPGLRSAPAPAQLSPARTRSAGSATASARAVGTGAAALSMHMWAGAVRRPFRSRQAGRLAGDQVGAGRQDSHRMSITSKAGGKETERCPGTFKLI